MKIIRFLLPTLLPALLPALLLTLTPTTASSQDSNIILLDDDSFSSRNFLDSIYGSIGGSYSYGGSVERSFFGASIGIDSQVGIFDFRAEAGYFHRGTTLGITRTNSIVNPDDSITTTEMDTDIESNVEGFELREAQFIVNPVANLTITGGRQQPLWGQFDVVSPVNLILPIEFQTKEISFTKESYRVPQDLISATYLIGERLEVQGTFFFSFRQDQQFLDILEQDYAANVMGLGDIPRATYTAIGIPNPSDYGLQTAAASRLLYYGDNFTAGFTYFQGPDGLGFRTASHLAYLDTSDDSVQRRCNPTATAGTQIDCSPVFDDNHEIQVVPTRNFAERNAIGLEVSVPLGRWTIKAEYLTGTSQQNIPISSEVLIGRSTLPRFDCDDEDSFARPIDPRLTANQQAADQHLLCYVEWIENENNGSLLGDVTSTLAGIGFDANLTNWLISFAFLYAEDVPSAKLVEAYGFDRSIDLALYGPDTRNSLESDFPDGMPIFNLVAVRYFGEERQHRAGVIAGFLGPLFGISFIYGTTWRDNIDFIFSLEAVSLVSDNFLASANEGPGNTQVELQEALSVAARTSLVLKF